MDLNINDLEWCPWGAMDEFRANSKLKVSEDSIPVQCLFFLRYAAHKFSHAEKELCKNTTRKRRSKPYIKHYRLGPEYGEHTISWLRRFKGFQDCV